MIAQESNKTVAQVAQEFSAFQALLTTYDVGKQLFPSLPQHTENTNPRRPKSQTPARRNLRAAPPIVPPDTPTTTFTASAVSNQHGRRNQRDRAGSNNQRHRHRQARVRHPPRPDRMRRSLIRSSVPPPPIPFVVTPPPVTLISTGRVTMSVR